MPRTRPRLPTPSVHPDPAARPRRAAWPLLAALCAALALFGCAAAPLLVTGVVTGGSIVGAEVEDQQQKGKRNDNWDYADEYFARGRNRTLGGPGANQTAPPGASPPAFRNQADQEANRTRPAQPPAREPIKSVSIPMPGQ